MEVFEGEMCQNVLYHPRFIKLLKATKWQSILYKNVAIFNNIFIMNFYLFIIHVL